MDYAKYHQDRRNLLIHIIAVPVFVLGTGGLIWALLTANFLVALAFLAAPMLSLAAQGRGHRLEPVPPEPFAGPGDFIRRIVAEQFGRFWLFLVSGKWSKALRGG
ncbi:MAG: terminase [Gammaproteobacteria bacterium]|nr:terminase [Gammaproteobacteria bacterium]MDH3768040.1 terminase [Gammaproteobacteria bacterium]